MLLVLPEEPRRGKHNFSKKQRWGMVGGPMAWAYGLGMRKKKHSQGNGGSNLLQG